MDKFIFLIGFSISIASVAVDWILEYFLWTPPAKILSFLIIFGGIVGLGFYLKNHYEKKRQSDTQKLEDFTTEITNKLKPLVDKISDK